MWTILLTLLMTLAVLILAALDVPDGHHRCGALDRHRGRVLHTGPTNDGGAGQKRAKEASESGCWFRTSIRILEWCASSPNANGDRSWRAARRSASKSGSETLTAISFRSFSSHRNGTTQRSAFSSTTVGPRISGRRRHVATAKAKYIQFAVAANSSGLWHPVQSSTPTTPVSVPRFANWRQRRGQRMQRLMLPGSVPRSCTE
jgi:hypothetical protein